MSHPVYFPRSLPICSRCPRGPAGTSPSPELGPRKSTNRFLPRCFPTVRARRPPNGPYSKTSPGVCRQLVAGRSSCDARPGSVSVVLRTSGRGPPLLITLWPRDNRRSASDLDLKPLPRESSARARFRDWCNRSCGAPRFFVPGE